MTTPFPPVPAPSTWAAGPILTSQLRSDITNGIAFLAGRPDFLGTCTTGPVIPGDGSDNPVSLDADIIDTWGGHFPLGTVPQNYYCPAPGWYLCEGYLPYAFTSGTQATFLAGIQQSTSSGTSVRYGEMHPVGSTRNPGPVVAELAQLARAGTPGSAGTDYVALVASQASGSGVALDAGGPAQHAGVPLQPRLVVRWACALAGSAPLSVPANPAFPPPYTTLTAPAGQGATSITVASTTGMVSGAVLGLDVPPATSGTVSPAVTETVTITGTPGATVPVTALASAHASGAQVSVPVSHQFLNRYVRDAIRFLTYPPAFRYTYRAGTYQMPTGNFPAGNVVALDTLTLDTYSAFSGGVFVAPVPGLYYCYGQVAWASAPAAGNYSAGFSVAGAQPVWGKAVHAAATGRGICVSALKRLRLAAGQSVALAGAQTTGSPLAVIGSGEPVTKMIIIWEAA